MVLLKFDFPDEELLQCLEEHLEILDNLVVRVDEPTWLRWQNKRSALLSQYGQNYQEYGDYALKPAQSSQPEFDNYNQYGDQATSLWQQQATQSRGKRGNRARTSRGARGLRNRGSATKRQTISPNTAQFYPQQPEQAFSTSSEYSDLSQLAENLENISQSTSGATSTQTLSSSTVVGATCTVTNSDFTDEMSKNVNSNENYSVEQNQDFTGETGQSSEPSGVTTESRASAVATDTNNGETITVKMEVFDETMDSDSQELFTAMNQEAMPSTSSSDPRSSVKVAVPQPIITRQLRKRTDAVHVKVVDRLSNEVSREIPSEMAIECHRERATTRGAKQNLEKNSGKSSVEKQPYPNTAIDYIGSIDGAEWTRLRNKMQKSPVARQPYPNTRKSMINYTGAGAVDEAERKRLNNTIRKRNWRSSLSEERRAVEREKDRVRKLNQREGWSVERWKYEKERNRVQKSRKRKSLNTEQQNTNATK